MRCSVALQLRDMYSAHEKEGVREAHPAGRSMARWWRGSRRGAFALPDRHAERRQAAELRHDSRRPDLNTMLRAPYPNDYAALASWLPDAEACRRWAGPLIAFPIAVESLARQLAVAGGASYILADADDRATGFAQHWSPQPAAVHLGRIIIAPAHRGRGLGRELCVQLIGRGRTLSGAGEVTLRVYRGNRTARALYESLGFSAVEAQSDADVLFMRAAG